MGIISAATSAIGTETSSLCEVCRPVVEFDISIGPGKFAGESRMASDLSSCQSNFRICRGSLPLKRRKSACSFSCIPLAQQISGWLSWRCGVWLERP